MAYLETRWLVLGKDYVHFSVSLPTIIISTPGSMTEWMSKQNFLVRQTTSTFLYYFQCKYLSDLLFTIV